MTIEVVTLIHGRYRRSRLSHSIPFNYPPTKTAANLSRNHQSIMKEKRKEFC